MVYRALNLREAAEDWRLHLESEGRSPATVRVYLACVEEFTQWRAGRISDSVQGNGAVDAKELRRFVNHLRTRPKRPGYGYKSNPQGNLSPDAVRLYSVSLKSFFRFLWEEGELPENPAERLRIPSVPECLPRFVSEEDLTEWLRPLARSRLRLDVRLYAAGLLILDSGLRVGELCGIRMEDLDFPNHRIRVMGKGSRERFVPVQERALTAVRKYLYVVRELHPTVTTDNLFISQSGTALTPGGVQKHFRSHSRRVGIRVTPHMLRHTFATLGLRNGFNIFELQKALGHATLEQTRRYASVSFEDVSRKHETASPVNHLNL